MTEHLLTRPGLSDPDGFMESIQELHRDRTEEESRRINARLILLLANHIGDEDVLREAIAIAGQRGGD